MHEEVRTSAKALGAFREMCRRACRNTGVFETFFWVTGVTSLAVAASLPVNPRLLRFAASATAGIYILLTVIFRLVQACSKRRSCTLCSRHRVQVKSGLIRAGIIVNLLFCCCHGGFAVVAALHISSSVMHFVWTVSLCCAALSEFLVFVFSIRAWKAWVKSQLSATSHTRRLLDSGSAAEAGEAGSVHSEGGVESDTHSEIEEVLLLPKPVIESATVTVVFTDDYNVKVTVPPAGDVSGVEVQYILDDYLPRHLCEGKRFRSAQKPRSRAISVKIRQSCRFIARLHADRYRDSELARARFVAIHAPSVIVSAGNCLLLKVPCLAFLTGDPVANSAVVVVGVEIQTEGVNGVPVDVPLMPVGPPQSPYHVFAVPAARRVGAGAELAPLLPSTKYQARVIFELDDPTKYCFGTGNTRLLSPWSSFVTTNSAKVAEVIASEKFSYLTRGKGLLFRRKEQIDVFRLTTQRLMRGKVKGYSLPRCVEALQRSPPELGVVHVPDRTDERVRAGPSSDSTDARQRLTHPDASLCSEWESLILFVTAVYYWDDQLTRRVALQILRSRTHAVPRGYEELVWILRCESCPPGLSVSDDSLSVGAGPGFRGGVGGAGLELTDNAAVGEITLFDPSSPAAGPSTDFTETGVSSASGDELKTVLAALRKMREQVQQRLVDASPAEVESVRKETDALLRSFPPSMLAVAREFLSLRPTSPESTSASPTSTSRRSHLASVTDSLLGMMIPGGLPVGPEAAAGAGNDTEEVSPSDPAPVAASGTSRAPLASTKLKKCTICFTADVSAVYAPCGHAVCQACGVKWIKLKQVCHECRQPVEHVIRIFL